MTLDEAERNRIRELEAERDALRDRINLARDLVDTWREVAENEHGKNDKGPCMYCSALLRCADNLDFILKGGT